MRYWLGLSKCIAWDGWVSPGLIRFTRERSRPQGLKNVHNFLMTVREMS